MPFLSSFLRRVSCFWCVARGMRWDAALFLIIRYVVISSYERGE